MEKLVNGAACADITVPLLLRFILGEVGTMPLICLQAEWTVFCERVLRELGRNLVTMVDTGQFLRPNSTEYCPNSGHTLPVGATCDG